MLIEKGDVQVYKRSATVHCVRPHFFDVPARVVRKPAYASENGLGEVTITFASGGTVTVFTDRPLLWVEPDRH